MGAFGVSDAVADASATVPDGDDGHPSLRSLVADGYGVITV